MKREMKAGEFKAKCLKVLDEVRDLKTEIIVTKHGKPVAKLVPIDHVPASHLNGMGRLAGKGIILGDIVGPISDISNAEKGFLINEEQG